LEHGAEPAASLDDVAAAWTARFESPARGHTLGSSMPDVDAPEFSQTRRPPGVEKPRRLRPRFHYELLVCGVAGHELVGVDARTIRPEDALVVRERDGARWYRCLRCDSWLALAPPAEPTRDTIPGRGEVELPLRGKPLRDKIVLRLIAVNRAFHFVVLGLLAVAAFAVAHHEAVLHRTFYRTVTAIQTSLGGPAHTTHGGLTGRVESLLSQRHSTLFIAGFVLLAYALVEGVEAVGLWYGRRWAEYLTFVVTASLLPYELFELAHRVTPFKVIALIVNVAVVAYLLFAKRLFGLRGGAQADEREREADVGWDALARAWPGAAAR
jgi:uncharacterized membrane protein (DUF2068 family)